MPESSKGSFEFDDFDFGQLNLYGLNRFPAPEAEKEAEPRGRRSFKEALDNPRAWDSGSPFPEREPRQWTVGREVPSLDANVLVKVAAHISGKIASATASGRKFVKIVSMKEKQREKMMAERAAKYDRFKESKRRLNPNTRPDYQKEYLIERQKLHRPGSQYENLQGPRDFPVLVEHYNAETKRERAHQTAWLNENNEAIRAGKKPLKPRKPAASPPNLTMTSQERKIARDAVMDRDGRSGSHDDPDLVTGMTKFERRACAISKAFDPLKGRADSSSDSDMDDGMFDSAPPTMMHKCSKCKRPTQAYLQKGLCVRCHDIIHLGK